MVFLFFIYMVFAIIIEKSTVSAKNKQYILMMYSLVFAIWAGIRDPFSWADTGAYVISFNYSNNLFDFSWSDKVFGYTEKGYFLLSVIIKTFTNDSTIYLTIISLLTFLFLYKFANKYCLLPLVALCVYIGRFYVGRNMMQIRACLAIALVVCGTGYITHRKMWKFLLLIFVAYHLHHSAIIALPLYFINMMRIKKWHILLGIVTAFILAGLFGGNIKQIVSQSDFAQNMATQYVKGGYAYGATLANPVIYLQCFVLLVFTFYEEKLSKLSEHYYTFRNGYFYSTMFLIILYQYAVLAGRGSTILATYEMAIVPMCVYVFPPKNRFIPYIFIISVYTIIFYYKYHPIEYIPL